MVLFEKNIVSDNSLPELTSEQAMVIYEGLKTKDANTLFLEDNIPTEYTEQVIAEMRRLESEMVSKMQGNFLLSAEESHYDEETGEKVIDKEAVYFIVTTEYALKKSMSSDLLDIDTVVVDVRIYSDGNPDETPSWIVYKNSFED